MTHIFSARHGLTSEWGHTVSLCGLIYPDVENDVMAAAGLPNRPRADLREFATDAEATCPACRKAREKRRPGWLRKLWRRIRGTEDDGMITIR